MNMQMNEVLRLDREAKDALDSCSSTRLPSGRLCMYNHVRLNYSYPGETVPKAGVADLHKGAPDSVPGATRSLVHCGVPLYFP